MQQESFAALGVSAGVERALAERSIQTPFPIQSSVIPAALEGCDVLAKSPTGSGKTYAFGLPLVERADPKGGFGALVLVPTRELALQVADDLAVVAPARGLRVEVAYGGSPLGPQIKRLKGAQIIVATPGRLLDLLERKAIDVRGVRALVLDEADRLLDMGFLPTVERIVRKLPHDRQTMLFSATLDGQVGDLARATTRDPISVNAEAPPIDDPGTVEHSFVPVTQDGKVDALIRELERERGLALVFVRTKRGADRLVSTLHRREVRAVALHGDMPQRSRERALAKFRAGEVSTLVATDVAARGLDLDDITHVINYDPPADEAGYVHRVGRTGRAGRGGSGITLVLPEQQADVSRVASKLGHRETFEDAGMRVAPARKVYSSRRGRRSRW